MKTIFSTIFLVALYALATRLNASTATTSANVVATAPRPIAALILDEKNKAALDALNASGDKSEKLAPVPLNDGTWLLSDDLLTDCGKGQTWEHYGDFLKTLPRRTLDSSEIVRVILAK